MAKQALVYLIEAIDTPFCKVGKSVNIDKRLKSLQGGCPYKLRLVHTWEQADEKTAYRTEAIVHRALQVAGYGRAAAPEWFKIEPSEAKLAVGVAIANARQGDYANIRIPKPISDEEHAAWMKTDEPWEMVTRATKHLDGLL